MAHYIVKQNDTINLTEIVEGEIGLDKIDFDNGLYIEIPEDKVQMTESLIEEMNRQPETDEEGNELPVWNPTIDEVYEIIFPTKYYYIKSNKVIDLSKTLNSKLYQIGETYDDYLSGKYVLLNEGQVHYYLHNLNDSIYLVWHLGVLPEPKEPTIEEVRMHKLQELSQYDLSDEVNGFTINGVIPAWFTREERNTYTTSVNAAKLLGNETLTFAVGDAILQVATDKAELMLAALQAYADACYVVTKQHEIAINSLDSIDAVNEYDYTTGYPEKLNFDLV